MVTCRADKCVGLTHHVELGDSSKLKKFVLCTPVAALVHYDNARAMVSRLRSNRLPNRLSDSQ